MSGLLGRPSLFGFPGQPNLASLTWLGRQVGLAHLGHRIRFQIYHELKI